MWEVKTIFYIEWYGETIWGDSYSDSGRFTDKQKALEFSAELLEKETVKFVELKESTIWRRK